MSDFYDIILGDKKLEVIVILKEDGTYVYHFTYNDPTTNQTIDRTYNSLQFQPSIQITAPTGKSLVIDDITLFQDNPAALADFLTDVTKQLIDSHDGERINVAQAITMLDHIEPKSGGASISEHNGIKVAEPSDPNISISLNPDNHLPADNKTIISLENLEDTRRYYPSTPTSRFFITSPIRSYNIGHLYKVYFPAA